MPKIGEYASGSDIRLDGFRCPECGGDIFIMKVVALHCYYCVKCGERYAYSDEMARISSTWIPLPELVWENCYTENVYSGTEKDGMAV